MVMQVYVNGHEWLAQELDQHHIGYTLVGNAFIDVDDLQRAQAFSDRLAALDWPKRLDRYARPKTIPTVPYSPLNKRLVSSAFRRKPCISGLARAF